MSPPEVGRLHVLTDETLQNRFSHAQLAALAARGGADAVQFREKRRRSTRELLRLLAELRGVVEQRGVLLVVNDRVDVALAGGARAVHLGRTDMDPKHARRILGREVLIGATANDRSEAQRLSGPAVDYLGVGPVFATSSKAAPAPVLGPEGLRRIVEAVDKPVIAIGGIDVSNAGEALAAGAHGIAVLSAVVGQRDPLEQTRRLCETIGEFFRHADRA
jgi:thiamine-phosphate pyrophosphorylase